MSPWPGGHHSSSGASGQSIGERSSARILRHLVLQKIGAEAGSEIPVARENRQRVLASPEAVHQQQGNRAVEPLAQVKNLTTDQVEKGEFALHGQEGLGPGHSHRSAEAAVQLDHHRIVRERPFPPHRFRRAIRRWALHRWDRSPSGRACPRHPRPAARSSTGRSGSRSREVPRRASSFERLEIRYPSKNAVSTSIIGSTSAVPAISRQECIESIGLPTSTVRSPTRAAVIGPIVDPQADRSASRSAGARHRRGRRGWRRARRSRRHSRTPGRSSP